MAPAFLRLSPVFSLIRRLSDVANLSLAECLHLITSRTLKSPISTKNRRFGPKSLSDLCFAD